MGLGGVEAPEGPGGGSPGGVGLGLGVGGSPRKTRGVGAPGGHVKKLILKSLKSF